MHDGAVGPGAGDRRKRNILEQAGIAAKTLQRLDRIDLAHAARGLAIEPGEKARHGRAVALLRRTRAGDLGRVLHRLHRHDRIAAVHHPAAIAGYQARDRVGANAGIKPHGPVRLAERSEIALEIRVRLYLGDFLEMAAHIVAELAAIDIERRPAVFRHDRSGEHDRRVRHVVAANVEQPRHRLRIGNHQRVGGVFLHAVADARELCRGVLAGIAQVVQHDRTGRRPRTIAPAGVDRIVIDGNEVRPRRFAGFGEAFRSVHRMQPRRKAELCAGRQVLLDPCRRRMFDKMLAR